MNDSATLTNEFVEHITKDGTFLATVIRKDFSPSTTTFITPEDYYQQCGFIVYPKNGIVKRHEHLPLQRSLVGTPETILVRSGKLEVEIYDLERKLAATVLLNAGDVILLVAGGHRITCLEDSVMMEIKQGPYTGLQEKEIF